MRPEVNHEKSPIFLLCLIGNSGSREEQVKLHDNPLSASLALMSHFEALSRPSTRDRGTKSMKRTFAAILALLAAAALFAALVHAVLVAAHLSEPAQTTVHGLTPRRLWATTASVLALVGVIIGWLALARPASRLGTNSGQLGAIMALVAGLVAWINGGLNLAIANGGPGTGNGVVGGAAALVLGLIASALGGLALTRGRRTIQGPRRMT
jgi:hypothetical protein